ncbi:hypothetical protein CPB83DRAFT_900619 [Crepidotus variabilis]|uniref:Uncharacterized protein n=1 Tax=Crepidotus variabilis TaxID=179855 RepID=A0A9P6JHV3_9AGAR|nr:hypothetical protein CPB83DRAFT_900619 [Crepidotus variabilis]
MGKKKGKAKKAAQQEARDAYICTRNTVQLLESCSSTTLGAVTYILAQAASEIFLRPFMTLMPSARLQDEEIGTLLNRSKSVQSRQEPVFTAVKQYLRECGLSKSHGSMHWEKRRIMKQLGVISEPFFFGDTLNGISKPPFPIQFIERSRHRDKKVRHYQYLSEIQEPNTIYVAESTGYYRVDTDSSAIFYSFPAGDRNNLQIELVILRNIATDAPFSAELSAWMADVIETACEVRRNVRPTHGGQMSQVGMNLGARHARVLGWAKSFVKNLDAGTMVQQDEDAIGVLSIVWSLITSMMPREVLDHVNDRLASFNLPRIASRNVSEGHGFHIQIGEMQYTFPTAERAPPEGYLSRGYEAWTHTDNAYCTFAFTYCVRRDYHRPEPAQPPPRMTTRHSKKKAAEPVLEPPPNGGASFVDVGLKVLVRQAAGTMMAIRPAELHGTTKMYGAVNIGATITFSTRVSDAWAEALALGEKVEIVAAAGVVGGEDYDSNLDEEALILGGP